MSYSPHPAWRNAIPFKPAYKPVEPKFEYDPILNPREAKS